MYTRRRANDNSSVLPGLQVRDASRLLKLGALLGGDASNLTYLGR